MTRRNHGVILRGDRNECPSCVKLFNSSGAFDAHRTGKIGVDRRCMTEDEMVAAVMVTPEHGFWIRSRMPQEARSRILGASDGGSADGFEVEGPEGPDSKRGA